MQPTDNREIEVRFLEIDTEALKQRLATLGAEDHGENLLDEIIFYDIEETWPKLQKVVRIRKTKNGSTVAFKDHSQSGVDGAKEVEFTVDSFDMAQEFLSLLGFLRLKRHQQKKRHSFTLDGVTVDIDTWPQIPTFVELEGQSEENLRTVADLLGLNWGNANTTNAANVIESYGIPVKTLTSYTFEKVE